MLGRIGAIIPVTPVPLAAAALHLVSARPSSSGTHCWSDGQLRDRLKEVNGKRLYGAARADRRGVGSRLADAADGAGSSSQMATRWWYCRGAARARVFMRTRVAASRSRSRAAAAVP